MRTIEWEAPALASLAAAHWLVAYERENSPRKRVRYENEIEFDGVAYMLMCEIELVEREHKAVSMMCGMVGALIYTFSDTFWFSAVRKEEKA